MAREVADLGTFRTAAEAAGVPLTTAYTWARRYPAFATALLWAESVASYEFIRELLPRLAQDHRGRWLADAFVEECGPLLETARRHLFPEAYEEGFVATAAAVDAAWAWFASAESRDCAPIAAGLAVALASWPRSLEPAADEAPNEALLVAALALALHGLSRAEQLALRERLERDLAKLPAVSAEGSR